MITVFDDKRNVYVFFLTLTKLNKKKSLHGHISTVHLMDIIVSAAFFYSS